MYRLSEEDFDDIHISAGSAEPFNKPDHKAKKHGRPRGRAFGRSDWHAEHYARRMRIAEHNALAGLVGGGDE